MVNTARATVVQKMGLPEKVHKDACLRGMDTPILSFRESAELLKALLPCFKDAIFIPPPVETVSLDDGLLAYGAVYTERCMKKFVIDFG